MVDPLRVCSDVAGAPWHGTEYCFSSYKKMIFDGGTWWKMMIQHWSSGATHFQTNPHCDMYPHFLAQFGHRAAKGQAMFKWQVLSKKQAALAPICFFSIHITNKTTCRTFGWSISLKMIHLRWFKMIQASRTKKNMGIESPYTLR